MPVPDNPKIYHILHVDKLPSVIDDGFLWSDAEMAQREPVGTTIGMSGIKYRRLTHLTLDSHPGLYVGQCVPFYFCPRSVMLYLLHRGNHPELTYQGGQGPLVHLEADLRRAVAWAGRQQRSWAFTNSNAGSRFFDDYNDLAQLHYLDWDAIAAHSWQGQQDGKQAEFLVEQSFPWELVERVGVLSRNMHNEVRRILQPSDHRPLVEIQQNWYY